MADQYPASAKPFQEPDGWRVRIQDLSGATYGAGVLVTNCQVLTCAHVAAAALHARAGDAAPVGELRIDFTAYRLARGRWRAWLGPGGWLPPQAGDLAVLEVAGQPPPTVAPARLTPCGPPGVRSSREVRLHAFGPNASEVQVDAALESEIPAQYGSRIQLQGAGFAQYRQRYDGAGVADARTGEVIGLLSAAPAGSWLPRMMTVEEAARLLRARGCQLPLGHSYNPHPTQFVQPNPRLMSWQWLDRGLLSESLLDAFGEIGSGDLDQIFRQLRHSFGPDYLPMAYRPGREVQGYFKSLIDACVEQSGATQELFSLMKAHFARRAALTQDAIAGLQRRVTQFDPEPVLTTELRHRLYDHIHGIDFAAARDAYDVATGPTGNPLPPYASDPIAMARELETLNAVDDLPCVVRFADELARSQPAAAARLRAWTNRYAAADPAVMTSLQRYREDRPLPKGRPVLMLEVRPDHAEDGRYKSRAVLHNSDALAPVPVRSARRTWGAKIHETDAAYDLAELRILLDQLLTHIRQPPSAHPGVVEFAVPRVMLNGNFDQWLVGGALPRALGRDRPVIVRMLDRQDDGRNHVSKWNWLLAEGRRLRPDAVQWLWTVSSSTTAHVWAWSARLPVCVALGFPVWQQDSQIVDEFSVAMSCGIPIMMWSRVPRARVAYRELERMLEQHCLLDLPDEIWRWRATTSNLPATWLGEDLTFMFDDPERRRSDAVRNRNTAQGRLG